MAAEGPGEATPGTGEMVAKQIPKSPGPTPQNPALWCAKAQTELARVTLTFMSLGPKVIERDPGYTSRLCAFQPCSLTAA